MFVTLLHVLFVCTSCSVGSTDGGGGSRRGLSIGLWEPDRGIVRISQQRVNDRKKILHLLRSFSMLAKPSFKLYVLSIGAMYDRMP